MLGVVMNQRNQDMWDLPIDEFWDLADACKEYNKPPSNSGA